MTTRLPIFKYMSVEAQVNRKREEAGDFEAQYLFNSLTEDWPMHEILECAERIRNNLHEAATRRTINCARIEIEGFWKLVGNCRSAALDINTKTGELALRCTHSKTGELGLGTPPTVMSDDWARIVASDKGTIVRGSER